MRRSDLPNVGAPDPELQTSPIVAHSAGEELQAVDPGVQPDEAVESGVCYFNGEEYRVGEYVCAGDELLLCDKGGVWVRKGSCYQ
ncbi:MAG: hypothetical protein GWN84_22030 [Gammaproteobacteria bacterium]|nr:hypothetical protein [Gammaproteobacteria bacterium]NIR88848.1 hypothetical protein [Gammaproteobacteria bacterium]NIU06452.1 hypothetical protein [Gammaproteobacteria bacterium]NIV53344.1 hypothetical protein [Gammaproteobacteria bacterium]NIV74063.1 hypothetical protein [Gammaproteobacteria bacterium]